MLQNQLQITRKNTHKSRGNQIIFSKKKILLFYFEKTTTDRFHSVCDKRLTVE